MHARKIIFFTFINLLKLIANTALKYGVPISIQI